MLVACALYPILAGLGGAALGIWIGQMLGNSKYQQLQLATTNSYEQLQKEFDKEVKKRKEVQYNKHQLGLQVEDQKQELIVWKAKHKDLEDSKKQYIYEADLPEETARLKNNLERVSNQNEALEAEAAKLKTDFSELNSKFNKLMNEHNQNLDH
ncbi:MAG: hypothetical protein AAF599_17835, partial [Bacteroidota bacterium]